MTIEPSSQSNEPGPQRRRPGRGLVIASVIWFFGFPALLVIFSFLIDEGPGWLLGASFAASWGWLFSGCVIYHALFNMAEDRWPEAKGIRAIVTPILKGLLFHHHHH